MGARAPRRFAGCLALAWALAGCGATSPSSPAATASPAPAGSPVVATSPSPMPPAPPATPAPEPAWTADPAPSGWIYRRLTDADLEIAAPGDWQGFEVAGNDPSALASAAPEQRAVMREWDRLVAGGMVRVSAGGSIGATDLALLVLVEEGDASLTAFAGRSAGYITNTIGSRDLARGGAALPPGDAVTLAYSAEIGDWPRFVELDHLIRFADGRSLTVALSASGPGAAAALETFAGPIVRSLRPAEPAVTVTPGTTGAGTHPPEDWAIDLVLPATWRWTWDTASYQTILDGLDPVRARAFEVLGPPSVETWTPPYAVDTASAPLPGGGLTMVMLMTTGADQLPTIEILEAERRSHVATGSTLVALDRIALPAGPAVRGTYRVRRSEASTSEVGMVSYELIIGGEIHMFAFLVPVEELDGRIGEWDAIMATFRVDPGPPAPEPTP